MKEKVKIIKEIANKILNSYWMTIIFGIILLLKTIFFYNDTIALTEGVPTETMIGTIWFIVTICCFLAALPNRIRIVVTTIVNLCLSLLLFGDNVYHIFSSNVLSIAQISNLQYGEEIMNTLPKIVRPSLILYFIDILIFIILLIARFLKLEKLEKMSKKQIAVKIVLVLVGIFLFIDIGYTYVEQSKDKLYNKDAQIREATIYGYHTFDVINEFNSKKQVKYKTYNEMIVDYDELKEEYNEKYGEIEYEFAGMLEGKSILIVQLESVQEFVVNKAINGVEITPNLNKFINENIEFTDMHMQSYSTTSDSEFTMISSVFPMENGMAFSKYFTNTYDNIYNMFQNYDYETLYIHGNDGYFWNRENAYNVIGTKTVFKEDFEDTSEIISEYMSDEIVYRQSVPKIEELEEPFFVNIVASSSHTPFTLEGLEDRSKIRIDVGKYKGTYFGDYLESMYYADYAFGVLIEDLKKAGLYEDTAILVYGDHNGLNMYNDEMIEFLEVLNPDLNDVDIKLNYTRVLCGMKIPGVEGHVKIDKPINKLDIKPTLAYLYNFEDGFSIGTNMFASKDFVCLNNGRIITDKYYYDEEWYYRSTGEKVDIENISEEEKCNLDSYYEYMKKEIDISTSININNLLSRK